MTITWNITLPHQHIKLHADEVRVVSTLRSAKAQCAKRGRLQCKVPSGEAAEAYGRCRGEHELHVTKLGN